MQARVDWFYGRAGCGASASAKEFLAKHGFRPVRTLDARRARLGRMEAFRLLKQAVEIYVTRGRFTVYIHLRSHKPDADALARLVLGRTGRLRAPSMRCGTTFVIGFDEATYRNVLGMRDARAAAGMSPGAFPAA